MSKLVSRLIWPIAAALVVVVLTAGVLLWADRSSDRAADRLPPPSSLMPGPRGADRRFVPPDGGRTSRPHPDRIHLFRRREPP